MTRAWCAESPCDDAADDRSHHAARLKEPPAAADVRYMDCSHCESEAVVKRGDEFFCGRCALAADWQRIIADVQGAHVEAPVGEMAQSA